ncbi:MAG: hypothetical protein AAGD14_14100 [Planctomycetota bacterium]
MRVWMAVLLAASVASAETPLDKSIEKIDRKTATRMANIARMAERAKQLATARRLYERALKLNTNHSTARRRLGFRKVKGSWDRTREKRGEVNSRKDTDAAEVRKVRDRAQKAEQWRAAEVVKAVGKHSSIEDERDLLLDLLRRTPRSVEVHEALGHRRHQGLYIRPEFEDAYVEMPAIVKRWRLAARHENLSRPTGKSLRVPGHRGTVMLYEVEDMLVSGWFKEPWPRVFADQSAVPYRFLRALFGKDGIEPWKPETLLYVGAQTYKRIIDASVPRADRKKYYAWAAFPHDDFYAFWVDSSNEALHAWTHSAVFYSAYYATTPDGSEAKQQHFDWFLEGCGYLASLEVADWAGTGFSSSAGTGGKVRYSVPPPEERDRAHVEPWLRAQLMDGLALSLPDLCNRSLNQLDLLASLQAASFVRFLAIWDEKAFRRLPMMLRIAKGKNSRDRTELALKACFGKGFRELEPLWLAFTLEIDLP